MKENINYKLLYSIATRYYHTNNLEAAKILYEELVSNNIIPEFEFDVDLWNEIGAKHGAWKFGKMINRVKMYGNGIKKEF